MALKRKTIKHSPFQDSEGRLVTFSYHSNIFWTSGACYIFSVFISSVSNNFMVFSSRGNLYFFLYLLYLNVTFKYETFKDDMLHLFVLRGKLCVFMDECLLLWVENSATFISALSSTYYMSSVFSGQGLGILLKGIVGYWPDIAKGVNHVKTGERLVHWEETPDAKTLRQEQPLMIKVHWNQSAWSEWGRGK